MPPPRQFPIILNQPGVIARVGTWPPWELSPGRSAPHPFITVKVLGNNRMLVLPITHSHDLSRKAIRIQADIAPYAAKPHGPLEPLPDVSWISITDMDGCPASGIVEIINHETLAFVNPNYRVPVRYSQAISIEPRWPALRQEILAALSSI